MASASGCRPSSVRPGRPNKAASGFFSSIIREPLAGEEAVLPVEESVAHWHASPRAAVGFLVHAAGLQSEKLGPRVNLTMPGVCCTVAEQIAALRRIAGDKVAARIRRAPDPLGRADRRRLAAPLRSAPRARARISGPRLHSTRSFASMSRTNSAARSPREARRQDPSHAPPLSVYVLRPCDLPLRSSPPCWRAATSAFSPT